jgi:hypothetical protein
MSKRTEKKLFLAVTADKYELPLYVADSVGELADRYGIKRKDMYSRMVGFRTGKYTGKGRGQKFITVKVKVKDGEGDDIYE